jgi:hypothetical protein
VIRLIEEGNRTVQKKSSTCQSHRQTVTHKIMYRIHLAMGEGEGRTNILDAMSTLRMRSFRLNEDYNPVNRFNPATLLFLSQARTYISNKWRGFI